MPKLVAVLFDRLPQFSTWAHENAAVLKIVSWSGTMKDGRPFQGFVCRDEKDLQRLKGYEFSEIISLAAIHPRLMKYAETRIR